MHYSTSSVIFLQLQTQIQISKFTKRNRNRNSSMQHTTPFWHMTDATCWLCSSNGFWFVCMKKILQSAICNLQSDVPNTQCDPSSRMTFARTSQLQNQNMRSYLLMAHGPHAGSLQVVHLHLLDKAPLVHVVLLHGFFSEPTRWHCVSSMRCVWNVWCNSQWYMIQSNKYRINAKLLVITCLSM